MKKTLSVLLVFILLICTALPCYAADAGNTYYIDAENGNDENSGTNENSAWKTLAFASSKAYSAGDRILLKAGSIFNGNFSALGGGTADNPVILGAYGETEIFGKPIVRNDNDVVLVSLHNVSGWTVENIEFTAPNGKGICISAGQNVMTTDITIKNCTFHDIWYKQCPSYNSGHCPIMLTQYGGVSRLRNISLLDCDIYDCAYGVVMDGLSREWTPQYYTTPEETYNTNYVLDGLNLNNILYDGIIIMSVYGMVIRNCALINTSLNDDYYTAPMWSHHASNFIVENCEIAGAKNEKDGMAVDFDGWTTDATYQYIYSHDNVRFIRNCCYDNYTKNANCTVRYCLSVNDNKCENSMAQLLSSGVVNYAGDEEAVCMDNFKFYNNTLINCSEIYCHALTNSVIANNIFVGKGILDTLQYMHKGGDRIITKFDGKFTNNCFWNMGVPPVAKNNFICNPKFVGTDETDKNSFVLSTKSKLLGNGIQVEDDMGEHDFYDNPLTDVHNIGCYEGTGEEKQEKAGFFKTVAHFFGSLLGSITCFIINCNNTYWLF